MKQLPTSTGSTPLTINTLSVNKIKGFTLIELLVVIAIIAILATIGATIFSGVQSRARDGRRQSDALAITKALEANKVTGSNTYATNAVPIATAWFSGGVVPTEASADRNYIIVYTTAAGASAAKPATWGAANPPVNPTVAGATVATVVAGVPTGAGTSIFSFQVCALLEVAATPIFCVASQQ